MRKLAVIFKIRKRFFTFSVTVIPLFVIFFGCFETRDNDEIDEQILATVDGVHLTESDLMAIVPGDFYDGLTAEHKVKIVEEWVNKELLYQEAMRIEIEKDPEIERLLHDSERNLLSNELLERELSNIAVPGEDELKEYYKNNKEYFELHTNEYKVRYALFDNKQAATEFYRKIKRDQSFSDLAKEFSKDPSSQSGGDLGIVNEEFIEPAIWEKIISTKTNLGLRKISDPFMVINGWGCVIVDEEFEVGSIKPFEYVRDLVLDMYMAEKREESQEKLIQRLSAKAEIKYEF